MNGRYNLTPEERTRALYAHQISAVVDELRRQNPRIWQDVIVADGQLVNATKRQLESLQNTLRIEFKDPDVALGVVSLPTRAITPLPYAQQSFLKLTLDILDELYGGRSRRGGSGPYFRRMAEAQRK